MSFNAPDGDWRQMPEQYPPHLPQPRHPEPGEPGRYGGVPNIGRFTTLLTLAVAARAGKNWYDMNGDPVEAAQKGTEAFVHWTIWSIIVFTWWLNFAIGGLAGRAHGWGDGLFRVAVLLTIAVFTIGVTWCRNIDRSLFRQGVIYRLYRPVARATEGVPTTIWYVLAVGTLLV